MARKETESGNITLLNWTLNWMTRKETESDDNEVWLATNNPDVK